MVYTYRVSITGQVFYYKDDVLIDLSKIPTKKRPKITKIDLKKIKIRKKLNSVKDDDSISEDEEKSTSDIEEEKPKQGSPRQIYHNEIDGVLCYFRVIELTLGKKKNKILVLIDKSELTQEEISAALPYDFFQRDTSPPPQSSSSSSHNPPPQSSSSSSHNPPPQSSSSSSHNPPPQSSSSSSNTPPPRVYYVGKVGNKTYYWYAENSLSFIYAAKIAKTKLTPEEIRNARPKTELDDIIKGQYKKWENKAQDDWKKAQEEWERRNGNDEAHQAPAANLDQRQVMRDLLNTQQITTLTEWKKWLMKNHPDKNAHLDDKGKEELNDLVGRVNTAVDTLLKPL